ncbi:ATP-binding protein [Pseudoalteromonas 'SMAR']|uniref:ATP-binding protein n=1 Tax=Pseudoalteromonas 'SMAR' TaxID=3416908 RepID=UPI003AF2397D
MERLSFLILILSTFFISPVLSQPTGYSYGVTEDDEGFIYFATQVGGYRFDGTHHIELNKLFDLPNNWVTDVEYSFNDNSLYIALGDLGIRKVDLSTKKITTISESRCWRMELTDKLINCKNGSALVSVTRDVNNLTTELMSDVKVTSINGNYIDSESGLYKVDGKGIVELASTGASYSKSASNSNGLLIWRNNTLYYYDNHGRMISTPWEKFPTALAIDGNTALIAIGNKVKRLSLFDLRVINYDVSSFSEVVKHIFIDSNDNLWLFSNNSIQHVAKGQKHTPVPLPSSYNLISKNRDFTFIGTETGVYLQDGPKLKLVGEPENYGPVTTDVELVDNTLYIATTTSLSKYDVITNQINKLYDGYVIVASNINGILYFGTNDDGLYKVIDQEVIEVKDLNAVMSSKEVTAIELIDSKLFIGTNKGFYVKDANGLITAHGHDLTTVTGFVKLSSGIYVSTFKQGLYKFQSEKTHRLETPQSISDVVATDDTLYIGTISGVYIYDGLTAYPLTGTSQLNVTPNSLKLDSDRIVFGTQYGIESFKLASSNQIKQPTVVGIMINGEFSPTLPASFRANQNINLLISAKSVLSNTEYQYKINDTWQNAVSGVIDFSHVEPGTYNLEIRARQSGGKWKSNVIREVRLEGEWYQTSIFYALLITFALSILSITTYLLLLYLKANFDVHEKLQKMYSFTSTHNLLALMTKAKTKCSSPDVNQHADGLVFIDEVIDVLVPMAHGNAVLGKRTLKQGVMALQASLKYEAPSSEFEFVCSTEHGKTLPNHIESDAYAVIYHSVKNSIEHGNCKRVEVYVEQVRGTLQVSIMDDGCGCSWFSRTFKYGLGFFLMKQTARRNNTKLVIQSCKKGTTVSISFKLMSKQQNIQKQLNTETLN